MHDKLQTLTYIRREQDRVDHANRERHSEHYRWVPCEPFRILHEDDNNEGVELGSETKKNKEAVALKQKP